MAAPLSAQQPRIALAHDWLVGLRGGEWVLDRLAHLYGPTVLYTLVDDGRPLTRAISQCRVKTSPLQRLPGAAGPWRRHYLPIMPWAVERLRVERCDLLISTSSAVMKSIIPPPGALHLCYCHSPARYIWEQAEDYARGAGGLTRRIGLRLVRRRFQAWDRRTSNRVTRFIANSRHTAQRIQRCFDRQATVIHPPVRTDVFTVDAAVPREDWLLLVSALEPYKRVDLAIAAAQAAGTRLRIVGDGSQRSSLMKLQSPNVEFVGRVSDDVLRELYRRARALLFPQVEDFGIIAAEAQACGCPVIACGGGGALDIVTERTGVLFFPQTCDALVQAIQSLDSRTIEAADCRDNAMRFSVANFDAAIQREVQSLLKSQTHEPR